MEVRRYCVYNVSVQNSEHGLRQAITFIIGLKGTSKNAAIPAKAGNQMLDRLDSHLRGDDEM